MEIYGQDGKKIKATKGRPPKAGMTDAEFEAVKGILSLPKGTHGSSLDRAAMEISLMRKAYAAVDPRTRKERQVSARWVSVQLAKRGISGKKGMRAKFGGTSKKFESRQKDGVAYDTGTRTIPSINTEAIVNGPPTQGDGPSTIEVRSEQPEATQ